MMYFMPLPIDTPWRVFKFGGTSVSTRSRWDTICRVTSTAFAQRRRVLVVVSALSGVTDQLKAITQQVDKRTGCQEIIQAIRKKHQSLLDEMGLQANNALEQCFTQLNTLCLNAGDNAPSLAWQAQVLAMGELMSSTLGAMYLQQHKIPIRWVDARDYLCAEPLPNQNEWASYLSASVPAMANSELVQQLGDVFITQGFIARNKQNETVVLGRGGADTSAAYFGALLKAERVEIWTDVPGLFSANPRQVPDARLIKQLDYEEAQEIATTGAKVLHPRCLNPLREARVPLGIKDTRRPELVGTEIGHAVSSAVPSVKAISARKGITLVSMETIGMWQQVGFLADIFEHFKRHGLSVDLIGSAETNVTVSLDSSENLVTSDVLSQLCADLARVCRVKVIAPCAAITLVGRGMRAMLHRLSSILAEFGQFEVHLISQSSNNLNLTFVVNEALVDALIPRLHALLIQADVLRVEDQTLFGASWHALEENKTQHKPNVWWRNQREELLALAAERTPRYVYDLTTVREKVKALQACTSVDRWHYALKANAHPAILRTLYAGGFVFECVSWSEVEAVCNTIPTIPMEHILFTPNFAPRTEYEAAFNKGVSLTLDSIHPLAHWGELFLNREIFLRVDLGIGRGHHDKVKTGGVHSKFGVSLDQIQEFCTLARRHNTRIIGLHAHLGSGILDSDHWREVYIQLASLAEQFSHIQILNIGGGLGVPMRPEDTPLNLSALDEALSTVKKAYPQFQLWLEPGRFLVAEAGALLARVTQTKRKGELAYVGLDTGMNSLIRPALYEAWHEIVNLTRLNESDVEMVQVVGPICETGDVLGSNRYLPPTHEGDIVLIAQTGAYSAVMASRYNLREPAQEVVIE